MTAIKGDYRYGSDPAQERNSGLCYRSTVRNRRIRIAAAFFGEGQVSELIALKN
jgi:hypothetical protein